MSNWLFPDSDVTSDDIDPGDVDVRRLDPADIEPGTSVLVAGPAMTGKRRIGVDILSGSPSRTACVVSTKQAAERVNRSFRAAVDDGEEWDLSVVDCTGGRLRRGKSGDYTHKDVSGPSDLTGIGIRLSGILQRWYHDDVVDPRVQLHSLSTLLMYTDLKRVFRFTHVTLSRIQTVGAVSVCTLDTTSRDSDSFDQLAHLFDATVEIREANEVREFRVRGDDFGPKSWTRF